MWWQSSDENSLHKFRRTGRCRTAFVADVGRSARGRESVAARQLITFWQIAEPVVLLVTSKAPAGPCRVLAGRLYLRERRLPLCRLHKKDPAGSAKAAEAPETEETGGLRCLLEALGGVNGSLAHFHFQRSRKDISCFSAPKSEVSIEYRDIVINKKVASHYILRQCLLRS